MQSIIDKLQTPQSFLQSVQELVIALQRTGDPGKLAALRPHLDLLSGLDPNPGKFAVSLQWHLNNINKIKWETIILTTYRLTTYKLVSENVSASEWPLLKNSLHASEEVVAGLISFIGQHSNTRRGGGNASSNGGSISNGGERAGSSLEIGGPSAPIIGGGMGHHNSRYKTSMCRDLSLHGSCPRGKNCSFAHSPVEMDQ